MDRNIRIFRQIVTGLKPYRMFFKEFKRKRKKKKEGKKERRKRVIKREKNLHPPCFCKENTKNFKTFFEAVRRGLSSIIRGFPFSRCL